jgi:hypothetical protein
MQRICAELIRGASVAKVRIFKFGSYQLNLSIPRFESVFPALPHVSLLDALALGNPRAIPQQGLSTITNVDDIDTHIASVEQSRKLTFLEAIDLPASARPEVMRDLAFMGITAGSLFPGLDGVYESLREKTSRDGLTLPSGSRWRICATVPEHLAPSDGPEGANPG